MGLYNATGRCHSASGSLTWLHYQVCSVISQACYSLVLHNTGYIVGKQTATSAGTANVLNTKGALLQSTTRLSKTLWCTWAAYAAGWQGYTDIMRTSLVALRLSCSRHAHYLWVLAMAVQQHLKRSQRVELLQQVSAYMMYSSWAVLCSLPAVKNTVHRACIHDTSDSK